MAPLHNQDELIQYCCTNQTCHTAWAVADNRKQAWFGFSMRECSAHGGNKKLFFDKLALMVTKYIACKMKCNTDTVFFLGQGYFQPSPHVLVDLEN